MMSISTAIVEEDVRDSDRPAAAITERARSMVDDLEIGDLSARVGESLRLPGAESDLLLGVLDVELRLDEEMG